MRGAGAKAHTNKGSFQAADAVRLLALPSPTKGEGFTPHLALRHGTRAEHDRVDLLFSHVDLTKPGGYARFLRAQARAYLPVEDALDAASITDLVPDWPARRRADALRADLAALALPLPAPLPAPVLPTPAAALGAWYVLEGSRLGGALLARGVAPGLPRAFLTAPGRKWAKSMELLNNHLYDGAELKRALGAARAVFVLFERAALEFVE